MKQLNQNELRRKLDVLKAKKAKQFKDWIWKEIEKCRKHMDHDHEYEFHSVKQQSLEDALKKFEQLYRKEIYGSRLWR